MSRRRNIDTRLYGDSEWSFTSIALKQRQQRYVLVNLANNLGEWLVSSTGMLSPWVQILGEAVIFTKL